MSVYSGAPAVFDPSKVTITVDGVYVTGLGESAISFSYSGDAVSGKSGLDGAVVFTVKNSKMGTCTLPLMVSSPQFKKLMTLAKNHNTFPIWCRDASTGRRAGGSYAIVQKPPQFTADDSNVEFTMIIADLEISTD